MCATHNLKNKYIFKNLLNGLTYVSCNNYSCMEGEGRRFVIHDSSFDHKTTETENVWHKLCNLINVYMCLATAVVW